MRIAEGHRTDVGRGRPENEDRFLVDPARGLYAVADGMGGHRAGEVASATAIETLQASFAAGHPVEVAIEEANTAVLAKAAEDSALKGMGTTLTAVAVNNGTALLGHVGDSRAYLMRDGAVTQVTDDHSLVEQLVREGRLTPEEAQRHPQRAIITRALGVDSAVQVDTYRVDLRPGDRLLICSDGLTNMLSDETIGTTLRRHSDPQQAADTLVDMANQAGGDDNITVVILDALADGGGATGSATAATSVLDETGPLPMVDETGAPIRAAPAREGIGESRETIGESAAGGPPGAGTTAPPPAPAAPPESEPRADPRAGGRAGRRSARSLLLWSLPVIAVIGIAIGAVGWYARRTYYVGLSADRVTLYKGVPGGLLGWKPTVDRQTDLTVDDLTPADRADIESGHRFADRAEANDYIARLEEAKAALAASTSTTTAVPPAPPADTPVPPVATEPSR